MRQLAEENQGLVFFFLDLENVGNELLDGTPKGTFFLVNDDI